MIHHILRRFLTIPLTLLLVTFVAFLVLRVTGDPVEIFLDINATEEQRQILVARLHLDEPLLLQRELRTENWVELAEANCRREIPPN